MTREVLATEVTQRLLSRYPDAKYELNWSSAFELLIATILAAQATDERVNQVTPVLFGKWPTPQALVDADQAELEEVLKPTGFFRRKAKAVKETSKGLLELFGGEVPRTVEQLVQLHGVARKTANVVLNTAYDLPTGIIVDTHVARVSKRIGLTDLTDPDKIEQELMPLVPQDSWTKFGPAMVLLGRYTCTSRKVNCAECVMNDVCAKRDLPTDDDAAAKEPES
ncbi:MAG: endonuclease III [Myxococcaceae bacterium]